MYSSADSAVNTTSFTGSTASSTGSTAIYAYLPDYTPSWLHVEDLTAPTHSTCAALLPSGELAMDNSEQQEELMVAVYNKDPRQILHFFSVCSLSLRGTFTCAITCVSVVHVYCMKYTTVWFLKVI